MKPHGSIVAAAVLALFFCPLYAGAQAYPNKAVHVIVVFPPGGSNDVTARIVFKKLEDNLKQQFVIDNRAGAAGTIGAAAVARSPADGYTMMIQSTTHVANAYMYRDKLQYDTLGDFIGVTPLARQVGVLVVHPSLPVRSVISGEVATTIGTIGSFFPYIKAGQMRPLGVTSAKRVKKFPDIPAIAESLPGFEFTAWVGSFVPVGTPRPIVDKLNAELKKAVNDPEVVKLLTNRVLDPMYMTPEEFALRVKSDYERYGKLMKEFGVI